MALSIKSLKAGQRISVRLTNEPTMAKRGNPLFGRVTRNHLIGANVACEGTWERLKERHGIESSGTGTWFKLTRRVGLVVHRGDKTRKYLYVSSPRLITKEYLVDGRAATAAELEIIRQFKKESGGLVNTYRLEDCGNAVD